MGKLLVSYILEYIIVLALKKYIILFKIFISLFPYGGAGSSLPRGFPPPVRREAALSFGSTGSRAQAP